jgi:hypothetical protein
MKARERLRHRRDGTDRAVNCGVLHPLSQITFGNQGNFKPTPPLLKVLSRLPFMCCRPRSSGHLPNMGTRLRHIPAPKFVSVHHLLEVTLPLSAKTWLCDECKSSFVSDQTSPREFVHILTTTSLWMRLGLQTGRQQ